jgi:VanZ family protein
MRRWQNIFLFWLPPILWMALIFWLSSFHKLQASPVSWQDFIIRKAAHFSEYVILFLLWYRTFHNTTKIFKKRMIIYSLALSLAYAVSDEFHQTFVSGRTGRLFDIGVDASGAVFGSLMIASLKPFLPKKLIKILEKVKII